MGKGASSSKKTINKQAWQQKLQAVDVDQEDMNRLVMNFLVTEGYVDVARVFMEESGVSPGVNLDSLQERMDIRKAVQCGNVEEAIEKVNDLNPEILEERTDLYFHLNQQQLIELIRSGQTEQALEFAQEILAPRGEENYSYLEELERTIALLAFDDAKSSPVGHLMDVSQRQKTASELNAAILQSQSEETEARLPYLLKLVLWSQERLAERANFPRIENLASGDLTGPEI